MTSYCYSQTRKIVSPTEPNKTWPLRQFKNQKFPKSKAAFKEQNLKSRHGRVKRSSQEGLSYSLKILVKQSVTDLYLLWPYLKTYPFKTLLTAANQNWYERPVNQKEPNFIKLNSRASNRFYGEVSRGFFFPAIPSASILAVLCPTYMAYVSHECGWPHVLRDFGRRQLSADPAPINRFWNSEIKGYTTTFPPISFKNQNLPN